MKKLFFILPVILFLNTALSQGKESSSSPSFYAKGIAATVMSTWKDSFAIDDKPAKWTYDMGVILKGMQGLWYYTGDGKYFQYIRKCIDFFVDSTGSIRTYKFEDFNLDNINNGRILLLLYRVTGEKKYWIAATQLRQQLSKQPRNMEGGFWHKKIYPDQMWLDGLYMAEPFYAEYVLLSHDSAAYNDIAGQFISIEKHCRDPKSGLLYHAWDASKNENWANKITGLSPNFWARAMGWYACALVDILDYFPAGHPKRKTLINILNRLVTALEKQQDKISGLWYDVLNYNGPGKEKNYFESSASSQFVYAIAKGVRMGYLPGIKIRIAEKGYNGLVNNFIKIENDQENLYGTVKVSGLGGKPYRDGSFDYYMSEPVVVNDPKGMGTFLQACNEMELQETISKGKGETVLLDNYFNHELKKDITGTEINWHYVWDEMDNGGYSLFGYIFNKYGLQTNTLAVAPDADKLRNATVYIIVDPDTDKETMFPNYIETKDIKVITDWVKKGGVLLLMGNDLGNAEFEHFNRLAEKFGIHFDENSKNHVEGNHFEQGTIMIPAGNTIFKNTSKVYIKELTTVSVVKQNKFKNGNSAAIELKNGMDNILAIASYGKGKVLAAGDPWFYNEYLDGRKLPGDIGNYHAADDLVYWIVDQTRKK
ncbi:MAG: glycoside hydrolase family 88 protein [Bacteroidetes bacterium]|nr:glycoside hydrolase family 88 protein [Bacteroidota bacterium]MBS1931870.1 glycoside hydrolase family 88 protein [Bacteroidota bacterium]